MSVFVAVTLVTTVATSANAAYHVTHMAIILTMMMILMSYKSIYTESMGPEIKAEIPILLGFGFRVQGLGRSRLWGVGFRVVGTKTIRLSSGHEP